MSDHSERSGLAGIWYNLTVVERWNLPILVLLFAVLIGGGIYFVYLAG